MKNSRGKFDLKFRIIKKNNFTIALLLATLFFTACEKGEILPISENEASNAVSTLKKSGSNQPYLSGTFVDFWNKSTWTENQWKAQIDEMTLVGVETIIIQFTAYNEYIWCYSPNNYSSEKYSTALPNLLKAASAKGVGVYVGLYFNGDYWSNTTNTSKLQLHAQRSKDLADDIWSQYSGYSAFKGWYISHEPAPGDFPNANTFNKFKNYLVNPIANHCKSISNKPVAIAAFFNEQNTSTNDLLYFMNRLGGCNLDIIMLQDGAGASEDGYTPHCALGNIGSYFNDANWGLYGESPKFAGEFWADAETFKPNGAPETFSRVEQKFNILDNYVTKIVTFQYFKDMGIGSPHTGANQTAANNLRNSYRTYYELW